MHDPHNAPDKRCWPAVIVTARRTARHFGQHPATYTVLPFINCSFFHSFVSSLGPCFMFVPSFLCQFLPSTFVYLFHLSYVHSIVPSFVITFYHLTIHHFVFHLLRFFRSPLVRSFLFLSPFLFSPLLVLYYFLTALFSLSCRRMPSGVLSLARRRRYKLSATHDHS